MEDFVPAAIAIPTLTELDSEFSNIRDKELKPKLRSLDVSLNVSKTEIRTSLKASTLDGVFACLFSNVTGGALLTNFLLELDASPSEIGILAAVPMLANLMQPLGAYFSEQLTSRHNYCFWIYSISRSLWLGLAIGIFWVGKAHKAPHSLILITFGVAILSCFLGALGSAPWLSWMAAIVPPSLRGRYFGLRNSAANLTNLISVPAIGLIISKWRGGSIQGYGVVLILGIISGIVSLVFQNFMVDVNPQINSQKQKFSDTEINQTLVEVTPTNNFWQDFNFLRFLLYLNLWTFSVNLSAPFFNVYMLDNLGLDLGQVTLYNSLASGANLLLLMFWGKLSDRIGNRPILIGVGIVFAVFPILWLITGDNSTSTWVWLPLLHLISGATAAAIDLCTNNLQIGIVPTHNQSIYFGVGAACAGVSGAVGTTAGGFLAQFEYGLLGLFALSGVVRLGALLPLVFVRESQLSG